MSTIIRSGDVPRLSGRLCTVDLADHFEEAKQVVAEAQARAQRLLEGARSEAERLGPAARQQGYDVGYREGFEKGYPGGKEQGTADGYAEAHQEATTRFNEQHAAIVSDLARLIAGVSAQREAMYLAAKRDLLDFAITLATKLTYRIGSLDRRSALANLERALQQVQSKSELTVRAHPDDLAAIEAFAASALSQTRGARGIHVVADEAVAPGGCVVTHETGEVDATLATQIDELVRLLLGTGDGRQTTEGSSGDREGARAADNGHDEESRDG